ncbi:MAG: response regulator, partial [Blastocatellia bacterium]|nr:response regulator [Blastocatellia bacterium]
SNSIQSLFSTLSWDGTPTIWIGTRSSGLVRWEKGRWTAFDVKNNLPNRVVTALLETQEKTGYKYWFGTMTGLASLSNGQWRLLDTSSGLPNNSVTALLKSASDNNNYVLWVGTDGGLGRLKDEKWTTYDTSSGLPSNNILSLLETANSNGGNILWIGTREGLAHSSSRKGRPFDTVLGLPKLAVYSLVETTTSNSRAVWVGTESGLWKLENGRWTVFNTSAGLPNNSVECLTEVRFQNGKRQLWAGTLGGVAILDLNVKFPKWQILAVKLPDSAIHKIVQGKDLKVYLFTNKGIVCLNENPSTEFDVYTFTNEDGLPSNESTGAGFVDFKGRIWAGTVGGAALFSPDRLVIDKTPKPLYVEKMTVNNSSVNFQEPIALSYDQNRISFDYALISYYRESGTLYQTQLVGFENDPTEWSSDSKREFAGLQAGDYIFKVWGKDYAGNLSGPYSVEFTIKPPPWATWWAYFIYVSAITGIVYLRIKLRLRSLAQRNRLLEAKVSARTMELETALNQLRVSEREARYAKELSIESEKRAIEASRAKSIFLASMSHELRTPLNAVLGFVQLMERAPDRTADDQAYLSIINRSGEHLLSLINDVLSVSKIEAGQLTLNQQPFDIHRLLNWVEEIFAYRADEKGLKLCFEISSNLPRYVLGDEGKLRQILINLLGNAIKFTERGGIVLKVDWQTGQAKFEIEDTGYGIAEDEIGKLFEAFVQTSSGQRAKEGTGLGLVISQNFVNLMGGDIRVKSRLGEGTLFSFDINLPQAESIDEQVKKPKVVGLVSRQKEFRILVADDIIENRKILVSMLSSVGFTVSEAVNGREAVEIWAKWHPDLIWMDVRMPEIDGITATRIIRSFEDGKAIPEYKDMLANYKNRGPRVCIIALTASIFHHDRDSMASAGCDDYVPKPYHEETIFKKMEEHLGVRYVYEKIDEVEKFEKKSRLAELVQQSNIPTEILTSLKESVMIGDVDEANRQVEKIESYDSQFAAELKLMLKSYKLNEIIALAGK